MSVIVKSCNWIGIGLEAVILNRKINGKLCEVILNLIWGMAEEAKIVIFCDLPSSNVRFCKEEYEFI